MPLAQCMCFGEPQGNGDLVARNGIDFPMAIVAMQIDGRVPILAHGREMPIFGPAFESDQSVVGPLQSGRPVMTSLPLANGITYVQSIRAE